MSHNLKLLCEKQNLILQCANTQQKGSVWKHFKGDFYFVISLVFIEETEEPAICYTSISNTTQLPWVRPLEEWNQIVVIDGNPVKRFQLQKQFVL